MRKVLTMREGQTPAPAVPRRDRKALGKGCTRRWERPRSGASRVRTLEGPEGSIVRRQVLAGAPSLTLFADGPGPQCPVLEGEVGPHGSLGSGSDPVAGDVG